MLKRKRNEKEEEREWEETFDRSKKMPKSPIGKREKWKNIGNTVERGMKKELKVIIGKLIGELKQNNKKIGKEMSEEKEEILGMLKKEVE